MLVLEHNLLYAVPGATPPCARSQFRAFETRTGLIVVATELPAPDNPGLSIEQCLPVAIQAWLDLKHEIPNHFEFWTHFNSRSFAQIGAIPRIGDPTFSRVLFEYDGSQVSIVGREIVLLDDAAKQLGLAFDELLAL